MIKQQKDLNPSQLEAWRQLLQTWIGKDLKRLMRKKDLNLRLLLCLPLMLEALTRKDLIAGWPGRGFEDLSLVQIWRGGLGV